MRRAEKVDLALRFVEHTACNLELSVEWAGTGIAEEAPGVC